MVKLKEAIKKYKIIITITATLLCLSPHFSFYISTSLIISFLKNTLNSILFSLPWIIFNSFIQSICEIIIILIERNKITNSECQPKSTEEEKKSHKTNSPGENADDKLIENTNAFNRNEVLNPNFVNDFENERYSYQIISTGNKIKNTAIGAGLPTLIITGGDPIKTAQAATVGAGGGLVDAYYNDFGGKEYDEIKKREQIEEKLNIVMEEMSILKEKSEVMSQEINALKKESPKNKLEIQNNVIEEKIESSPKNTIQNDKENNIDDNDNTNNDKYIITDDTEASCNSCSIY